MRLRPAGLGDRAWCACLDTQKPGAALRDVRDELVELVREPSRDEASDVLFGVGRFLGAMLRRQYVPLWGAGAHIEKIAGRMTAHGCVRSGRHLENGRCPSLTV